MDNKAICWLHGDLTEEKIFEFAASKGYDLGFVASSPSNRTARLKEIGTFKHLYGIIVLGTCKHVLGQTSSETTDDRSDVMFPGYAPGHIKAEQVAQLSMFGKLTTFVIPMPNSTEAEVKAFEEELMVFTGMRKICVNKKGEVIYKKNGKVKTSWVTSNKKKGSELFDHSYEMVKHKLSGKWDKDVLKDEFEEVYAAQGSEMSSWKHKIMNRIWIKKYFPEKLEAWRYDVKILMNQFYKEFKLTSEEQLLFESKVDK